MGDQLIRFISGDSQFRVIAAETTVLCEKLRRLHGTDPTATVALGRLATGAALLGGLLKGNQRLAIALEANGPLQKLHAETDAEGHIRASVKCPIAGLPPRDNRFDVANGIGKAGFLHVIKDLGLKEPYRGMVQLQTSEVGDDIAYYLTHSEQVPSSVILGITLDRNAEVGNAGGLMVQALPGCADELITELEKRLMKMPSLSSTLQNGGSIEDLLDDLFFDIECGPSERTALSFRCSCNRKQVSKILENLGRQELEEMSAGDEDVDVTCEYCRQTYRFSPADVSSLIG
ncbi:MAG: Hsp33 family molecular chaperone HslO [Desulfuromonas sp.]|nr:MAG: Hsp33 family molecular chaperone HslO [Desulfuromonas sp.]